MNQNPQLKETPNLNDKLKTWLVFYTDMIIRGLISFVCIGLVSYAIFVYYLKINPIYLLPIVFILSILASPLLIKIKLGEKIINKYDNFLIKAFKLR